ncbi:DEKNAAC103386 [Brettanomyces naardenensis]|uniref:DEKNAAC103386 n=1 Tax=Brettanomyces naardenensis TaxID=13370 RepID=A0A448YP41_BRENA|nr:DEKNAAC103386 [Brettanomyces naardenensis]
MSSPVEDFERILKEMGSIKPPGVSGSRIKKLKELFLSNVDQESQLVQKLYDGCKASPASNKLGPLYVVDAVVRGLIDELGKSANGGAVEIPKDAPDGTAAAAVLKIQTLVGSIVEDAVKDSSDDVKEKIRKLLEIWDNCHTFDQDTLIKMKKTNFHSTTPPGTPPKKKVKFAIDGEDNSEKDSSVTEKPAAPAPASKDPASVLQALANLAKKAPSPPSNSASLGNTKVASPPAASQPASTTSSDPNAIFQMLQNMNKMGQQQQPQPPQGLSGPPPPQYGENAGYGDSYGDPRRGGNFNRGGRADRGYRERERDDRGRGFDRGGYDNNNGNNGGYSALGRRRERSPRRNPNPKPTHVEGEQNVPSNSHYRERHTSIDPNLPSGTIGVYSRTIFIGGVPHNMDEVQLAQILRPYAEVQSVILNSERKHAFVKVYSRPEAEQVIQAFSVSHPSGLRARWGVGFGPRDCCDYQSGVSTIPISRLTDADKRWVVSAEWGGTGGQPLQPGITVEEPDIEVGHGVSSKSISRKMPTNSSSNGPKSDGLPVTSHGGMSPVGNNGFSPVNNPGNLPMNYGGYGGNGGQGGGRGYDSPAYNSPPVGMLQQQQQRQPMAPPQYGGNNMNNGQVDQTQLMATMMAAMQQMQGQQQQQQGQQQGQPDMAQMFQNLASMMRQNQRQ